MPDSTALLRAIGLKKSFGATRALDGVDLTVRGGEVHALIGENGAGKSTLMNILSGLIVPDAGEVEFKGASFRPSGPADSRRRGIAHIHQELSLCPHLTVAENIFLGAEPQRHGLVDHRSLEQKTREVLAPFGQPAIGPLMRLRQLPLAAKQVVEICRALAQNAALILMDEPTSSLQGEDVGRLFDQIRRLRDSGVSILYISHFLEEVREIADRFTVLRDGRSVLAGSMQDVTNDHLISAMVGRKVAESFPQRSAAGSAGSEIAFRVQNLRCPPAVHDASFELRRGEILGIAGLIGSGRTELLRALFGLDQASSGSIEILGRPAPLRARPDQRIAAGIGFLSEDRKGEGLALGLSLADNVTMTSLRSLATAGWINLEQQKKKAADYAGQMRIRASGPEMRVVDLSGGNQQKALIARLLHQDCPILLLDEPTRGVDVGSKAQIYETILSLARSGKSVLMVSSYLPELFGICDRLAVMSRGRLGPTREIARWTPEGVLEAAIGGMPAGIGDAPRGEATR